MSVVSVARMQGFRSGPPVTAGWVSCPMMDREAGGLSASSLSPSSRLALPSYEPAVTGPLFASRVHAGNVAGPGPHVPQPQKATRAIADVGYGRRPNQSSSRLCGEALGGNVPLGPSPYARKASISSRCGSTSCRTLATIRGSRVSSSPAARMRSQAWTTRSTRRNASIQQRGRRRSGLEQTAPAVSRRTRALGFVPSRRRP